MIVNQVIGRSFKGVLKYVFGKGDAEPAFSNLANDHTNIKKMTSEFLAISSQRSGLSRNVAHIQFSPNPEDNLTNETFEELVKKWMDDMGYKDCLHTVAYHHDTDIKHAHLIVSRVDLNGEVVSDKNNYTRNMKVTRALEKEFELIPTEFNGDSTPKWQRDKVLPPHDYIKESIKAIGSSAPSMTDFIKSMKVLGIDVELKISSKANIAQGISFKYENYSVTGSKVGYSIKNLEKKLGVKYEQPTRNSGIFSSGTSEDKARQSTAIERIQERISRTEQTANEPIFPVFQRVIKRAKSAVDKFRATVRELGRNERELPRIVDEFERNNSEFRKIFEVLESRNSVDMLKKKELFKELRSNLGKNNSVDIALK